MARKRTDMRKIKDVLRLKFEVGLSHRDIGQCLSLGPSTVSEILSRFKSSDLSWPLPPCVRIVVASVFHSIRQGAEVRHE